MFGHYIVFEGVATARLKEFKIQPPKHDEVLLENEYSVISAGTEGANLKQLPNTVTAKNAFPHYPGYSAAGRVLVVGDDVKELKAGDRVIIPWGGHRSHTVKREHEVFKIEDDSIDLFDAAMAHIASFAFLGVRKLRIELGEPVMVAGMGLLGAFALQIASLSGASPVLVSDPDPVRRQLALTLGASKTFSPTEDSFIEKIREAAGGDGPKAVIEVTGLAAALQQALEYIAWEGRISLLGCTRISDIPVDFYKYIHSRGVSLIGAHTLSRPRQESKPGQWTEHDDYRTFLKLVKAGKLQIRPLISEIVSPENAYEVYSRLLQMKNAPIGIMFDWKQIR